MSDAAILEGAVCKPNISFAGRKRRRRISIVMGVVSVGLLAAAVLFGVRWEVRLLIGLPVMMAAISGLQVTRNTCVAHAAAGTFEHEDFSTTKVDAALAAASRKVARTIYRDGVLAGVAAAALAALIPTT